MSEANAKLTAQEMSRLTGFERLALGLGEALPAERIAQVRKEAAPGKLTDAPAPAAPAAPGPHDPHPSASRPDSSRPANESFDLLDAALQGPGFAIRGPSSRSINNLP